MQKENLSEIVESQSSFIQPGIHEVLISKMELHENEGISSFIEMIFTNSKEQTVSNRFYYDSGSDEESSNRRKRTLGQLKHISTKIVKETDFNDAYNNAKTLSDFTNSLSKLILNKSVRIKFIGKEIPGKDGKSNWFKATIGGKVFAENIQQVPSLLTFDPNNKWDMKRLPVETEKTFEI
ncbi:MAG: hypothetical protein K1X33_06445 [Methanobacteriaceae archaeon]|nr:hypothetical protein [Methanobacteriaceae archaeon]RTK96923.1 MAG: hypothetical protein EKK64_02680 [Neisseriaceae bacterium]